MRIPACAQAHNGPLVRAVREQAIRIWQNRAHLDRPVTDRHGAVLVPDLKNFFGVEAKRADGLETLLATILVQVCDADYRSKWILEQDHQLAKADRYLSLRRTAIRAGFIPDEYSRDPGDRIERAVAWERQIGLISYTEHVRVTEEVDVEQPDGTVVKQLVARSKASKRRLSFAELGQLGPTVEAACVYVDRKARQDYKRRDKKFKKAVDEMHAAPPPEELPAPDPLAPAPRAPGAPDPDISEAVREEHPDWLPPQIFAEARRREALVTNDSS